jgi:hypothetical protein
MDVAAKKFTKLGDPGFKGNYLWPMYAGNGDIYFVADRIADEKNVRYGGPDVMKSVNKHPEDFGARRGGYSGDASHERQPVFPEHLSGRPHHCVRREHWYGFFYLAGRVGVPNTGVRSVWGEGAKSGELWRATGYLG